jgi:hypothetical protein
VSAPELVPIDRPLSPAQRVYGDAARTVEEAMDEEGSGAGWEAWVDRNFPESTSAPFADRHRRLWDWFAALTPGVQPQAQVEVWPRGGAKSTTVELGISYAGRKKLRRFALYVSATQGQANKHVQAIAARFEAMRVPRARNRYGNSLGWRMDILRVAGGFNVLALGLDAASRGVKLDDFRPDLIVFDDVDDQNDSEKMVKKKVGTITKSILPMGSADVAVLVVQNRIHAGSIVSQLADKTADFLHGAQVYEQEAVVGLQIEGGLEPDGTRRYRVVAGEPTWLGQDLDVVEAQINLWGRVAFMREAQHDLSEAEGGMWNRERDIDPFRARAVQRDELRRVVVAIDPNATGTGDAAGIVAAGIRLVPAPINPRTGEVELDPRTGRPRPAKLHGYLLEDATVQGGPLVWAKAAVDCFQRWDADALVAESNNGGEMVAVTIGTVEGAPHVKLIHASRGKTPRARPVQKLSEEGRIHHVGVFVELEVELCSWEEGDPSPNRLDAFVWAMSELLLGPERHMPHSPGRPRRPQDDDDDAPPAGTPAVRREKVRRRMTIGYLEVHRADHGRRPGRRPVIHAGPAGRLADLPPLAPADAGPLLRAA